MSYALGDDVMELELHDGPIEVWSWYSLVWDADQPDRPGDGMRLPNPDTKTERRDFDGRPKHAEHRWDETQYGRRLVVQGWELRRIQKVYSEQRAQYIARKDMGVEPDERG
jgi:hypothetical protein